MRTLLVLLAALALISSAGACHLAPPGTPGPQASDSTAAFDTTFVTVARVENRSVLDARVYIIAPGNIYVRLGDVIGTRTTTFRIPPSLTGHHLVFYVEPVGSLRRIRTDAYLIPPGSRVELMLEMDMNSYALSVF